MMRRHRHRRVVRHDHAAARWPAGLREAWWKGWSFGLLLGLSVLASPDGLANPISSDGSDLTARPVSITPISITMDSWAPYYEPSVVVVLPNTPVEWVNPTASPHAVRHDGCADGPACLFDSGAVHPNGIYRLSGLPPGQYPYHCTLHPVMRGVVIVKASHQ